MAFNMHNRNLLSLMHHTKRELMFLLDLSRDLKRAKYSGTETQHLKGKNIALIFEKTSTRTRCAFEVASYDQGANVTYIDPNSSQIGHKETMKDTARVLGRMYDAIEYRGFKQEIVEDLAKYAGVPVFNGLTAEFHPTQMIADVLTMREHSDKPLHDISYAYLGDARNNMGNSLLLIGDKLGMDVRIGAPKALWPEESFVKQCQEFAKESGAKITLTEAVAIPFEKLTLSQANVRRIANGQSIEDLAEDIAHRGLLQSLSVRPILDEAGAETGRYEVPADLVVIVSLVGAGIILFGLLSVAAAAGLSRGSGLSRLFVTLLAAALIVLQAWTLALAREWSWWAAAQIVVYLLVLIALWAPPAGRFFRAVLHAG